MPAPKHPEREYYVPVSYNAPPSVHKYIADRASQQDISAAAFFRQIIGDRMDNERLRGVASITPEEEIAGLTRLCQSWRQDCQRYAEGLRKVRAIALRYYAATGLEFDGWREVIEAISSILAHETDCQICGEDHEGNVPLACETGDGE